MHSDAEHEIAGSDHLHRCSMSREYDTSSVLGGKNSNEKKTLPEFWAAFILSTTFMLLNGTQAHRTVSFKVNKPGSSTKGGGRKRGEPAPSAFRA